MSSTQESFQIPLHVAETYEAKFVPSIFREWAPHLLDIVGVDAGCDLLDVACGTGIVARTAADRVTPGGSVIGVDLNEAMLTVARRIEPDLDWRQGDVAALPFTDESFDAVVCQMAFMFFSDRAAAFSEMRRVARPQGAVGVVVPSSLDSQPAYREFVEIAARHAGPSARQLLGTYWNCGDLDELTGVMESSGLRVVDSRTRTGTARFDDSDAFVATEVEGSPLAERIDDQTYARVRDDVRAEMSRFNTSDGTFEIPLVGHVVAARRS